MKTYKVVPCPSRIVARPKENLSGAYASFAQIVEQESLGGWELVTAMPVSVETKKSRLRTIEEQYNLLVFAKDVDKAEELPEETDKKKK